MEGITNCVGSGHERYGRTHLGSQAGEVRTAVVHRKSESVIDCDYVWKHANDSLDFPLSSKTAP